MIPFEQQFDDEQREARLRALQGLKETQRRELIDAANVVAETVVADDRVRDAVELILGFAQEERANQLLHGARLNQDPAIQCNVDTYTRGRAIGLEDAAAYLVSGDELRTLVATLTDTKE